MNTNTMAVKTSAVKTDAQWQKECRRRLMDAIGDRENAARVVAYLDANPELKAEILSVYYKALNVLKPTVVKSELFLQQLTEDETRTLRKIRATRQYMGDDCLKEIKTLSERIRPEIRRTAVALTNA